MLNNTIAAAELPSNAEVAQTLINAANSNETLSVALTASSIQVICEYIQHVGFLSGKYFKNGFYLLIPQKNIFTAGPMPSTTESATSTTPSATVSTTAALTTTETISPSATTTLVTTIRVSFRSRLSTFTSDLEDQSSEAFKNRATMITTQVF